MITWVDGMDPLWRKKKASFSNDESIQDDVRYRDYGTLKYLFRSIDTFCPWVNKIHLITDNQIPGWLNIEHPKLNLVFHQDFIPQEYLPTFNSNTIELNLFRLKDLAEKFILFNDDMFVNGPVTPEDFFVGDQVLDYGIYNRIAPVDVFAHTLINNLMIINKHFNKRMSLKKNWRKQFSFRYGKMLVSNFLVFPYKEITGYFNPHLPQPHLKSTFSDLYQLELEAFEATFYNRVRGLEDINHWLCRYWMLEEGNYQPQKLSFGKYFNISEMHEILQVLRKEKVKLVCINDEKSTNEQFEAWQEKLEEVLQWKFPAKSSFEW